MERLPTFLLRPLPAALEPLAMLALDLRWPEQEVPVGHITNGLHVPSWDSAWADRLWTRAGGKERWRGTLETLSEAIQACPDEELRTSWRITGEVSASGTWM